MSSGPPWTTYTQSQGRREGEGERGERKEKKEKGGGKREIQRQTDMGE